MKKYFIAVLLSIFCQISFAEYVVIDHIVYDLDFVNLTATVLNFQIGTNTPCTVTIPETVRYKNDVYTVTSLSYYAFNYDAIHSYQITSMFFGLDVADYGFNSNLEREREEAKFNYDYKNSRANIEYLNLPNTLLSITAGAFQGMIRLKQLRIPASVTNLTNVAYHLENFENLLYGNQKEIFPRLESIEVLGIPTCVRLDDQQQYYYKLNILSTSPDETKFNYISQMAMIIAGIDSTGKTDVCPKLKSFTMPAAQAKLKELVELKKYCNVQNNSLKQIRSDYNSKLQNHPYFDGSQLELAKIDFQSDYTKNIIDKQYTLIKNQFTQQFNELFNGKMELNLRTKNTARYIEIYKNMHPEHIQLIDSIYREYRCYDTVKQYLFVLQSLDKQTILMPSCRKNQFDEYNTLFRDKLEFDERYNIAKNNEEFELELSNRNDAQIKLNVFKDNIIQNSTIKLQGMAAANKGFQLSAMNYLKDFKRTFYYDEAVQLVFDYNQAIISEYSKNGQYFSTKDDFFNAYISTDYKAILKAKKQNK